MNLEARATIPDDPTAAPRTRADAASVLAVLCGLAAAWCAAGSVGLYGVPLLRTLSWVLVGVAVLFGSRALSAAQWPARALFALVAACVGAFLIRSDDPAARVAGVAVLWLMLPARDAKLHLAAIRAVCVFAGYVFAVRAVPALWYLANLGGGLELGMTFGAVDVLVLISAFHLLRLRGREDARKRALVALGGVALCHALYLVCFFAFTRFCTSHGPDALANAAELAPAELADAKFYAALLATKVWNAPTLAALLQLALCAFTLFRASGAPALERASKDEPRPRPAWPALASAAALVALAAATPAWLTLPFGKSTLTGKRIVTYEKCYGNWDTPKHGDYGRLSIGMYGMLGRFVKSLGGELVISKELSEEDLRGADALVLLYPHEDWLPGQLDRIDRYVKEGGALLLMGEHTTIEKSGGQRYNDILAKAGVQMRIAFDTAEAFVGGWLQSYDRMVHATTIATDGDHNDYGIVAGASVDISWPARPLIFGRYGWNDPGDTAKEDKSFMGNRLYDAGERIGDLVLAAEQDYGDGVIMAFGDPSTMTNGITMGAHGYSSRLLAWLASRPSAPSTWWRQLSGLAALALLLVLTVRSRGLPLWLAAALFSASITGSAQLCAEWTTVLPDGRSERPNDLAYFDCAHFGRWSDESWRDHGTMGLRMTLNRNGYQCLELRDFDEASLERAGLLVSLAPRRDFDAEERALLRRWVADGGLFVLSASYPDRRASVEVLRDFGFEIGRVEGSLDREPQPYGHFKSPYHQYPDGAQVYVRFHEGWPMADIAATSAPSPLPEPGLTPAHSRRISNWLLGASLSEALPIAPKVSSARPLAYGKGNRPVAMLRRYGLGTVVVIADSLFGINKNLERVDGSKFEGMRENADFWRWLLSQMRGDPEPWYPPHPNSKEAREAK